MALFHSRFQVISRSTGRSAPGAAAYRAGCCLVDERTGEIFDYTRKRHVDLSRISLPPGAPDWMRDRSRLWNSAEAAERRKDAQVCREIEFSLPAELAPGEQARLAERCIQVLVDMGMVVDWNCHHLGGRNPHFHALAAMRRPEAQGWARTKERAWNDRGLADHLRATWAGFTNEALAGWSLNQGIPSEKAPRVDHRSFEERGIVRIPQNHNLPAWVNALSRVLRPVAKAGDALDLDVTPDGFVIRKVEATVAATCVVRAPKMSVGRDDLPAQPLGFRGARIT